LGQLHHVNIYRTNRTKNWAIAPIAPKMGLLHQSHQKLGYRTNRTKNRVIAPIAPRMGQLHHFPRSI
jgi:hypothetical protein